MVFKLNLTIIHSSSSKPYAFHPNGLHLNQACDKVTCLCKSDGKSDATEEADVIIL